jgi:hypothetical protein
MLDWKLTSTSDQRRSLPKVTPWYSRIYSRSLFTLLSSMVTFRNAGTTRTFVAVKWGSLIAESVGIKYLEIPGFALVASAKQDGHALVEDEPIYALLAAEPEI